MKKIFQMLILTLLSMSSVLAMNGTSIEDISKLSSDQIFELLEKQIISNDPDKDLSIQQLFESKKQNLSINIAINELLTQFKNNPDLCIQDTNFINLIIETIDSITKALLKLKGKTEKFLMPRCCLRYLFSRIGFPYNPKTTKWYREYCELKEKAPMFEWCLKNVNAYNDYKTATEEYKKYQAHIIAVS